MKLVEEFISQERRDFGFRIGTSLASALSGFIAGVIVSSIIWGVASYFHLAAL